MIAILGSFGHCIGMCGGIVLAYSSKLANITILRKGKLLTCHILYNIGRITTYGILGGVVGALGSVFSLSHTLSGILFITAGIAMILAGLSLFGKITWLTRFEHSIQNSKWYQRKFQQALSLKTPLSLYTLGILNGLLPCGFVYAFLFSAAGFASPLKGALVMLIFGIGTLPALLFFGLLANTALCQPRFRKVFMNLAALAIMIFGGFMVNSGIASLQNPPNAIHHTQPMHPTDHASIHHH